MEILKWSTVLAIIFVMYKFVNKDILIYQINQNLPPLESMVVAGMVTGDKTVLSKKMIDDFSKSGLIHLIVASGANVMLITGSLVEGLSGILGRKKTIVLALVLAWGYAGMTGWQPPIVRAIIMVSILYWAQLLGRKFNALRGLGLVCLIMVAGEPEVLRSFSFWLSLAAFGGVLIGNNKSNLEKIVWVNVMVSPILWLMTGKVNLISPIANMLVVGMTEVITGVAALTMLWGGGGLLIVYPLVRWVLLVAEIMARYY